MITKIIDNNPISFDYDLRYLGVDTVLISGLCNESFKKELFFNSISFEEISLEHYIYLLFKHNFYSEFNFKAYKDIDSLKSIVERYLELKMNSNSRSRNTISSLDKFILQLASPLQSDLMEIDHIFPLKDNETPEHIKSRFNLNHPANLCYLSKSNNQRKSNRPPSAYLEYLETQNETKLHTEFLSQTFWNELISESFNGEINNKAAFDSYLTIRGQRLIESLVARVSGGISG